MHLKGKHTRNIKQNTICTVNIATRLGLKTKYSRKYLSLSQILPSSQSKSELKPTEKEHKNPFTEFS
jgi:hypothetical protein